MKKLHRPLIFLCIIALLLSWSSAANIKTSADTTLLMQVGNSAAIENGKTVEVENSAGLPCPLFYSITGTAMLPLYYLSEQFGLQLSWNALTKQTEIDTGNTVISVSSGSNIATVNGIDRELSSAVTVADGSTFVPVDIINHIPGMYCHEFSPNDGSFILVTTDYGKVKDQDTLISYMNSGLRILGPSKTDITTASIAFRANSMYSHASGEQTEILSDGKRAVPYCTTDGYLMIPFEYALKNSGANLSGYSKYSDSCDFTIGSKTYSVYYGEHFILSGGYEYSNKYYCELRSGAVYISASAFERLTGLTAIYTKSPVGVVFSAFSGYASMAEHCQNMVASLPDKRADAEAYVALTFDDGPSGALTERLLDGLMERGAHATFFLCDYRISAFSSVMERYVAEGHEVANHSATHASLTELKGDSLAIEIDSTNTSISASTGVAATLLRPPGGGYNKRVLDALKDRGMSCIIWSVDPMDWKYLNTEKVVNNIISSVSDGDIVLLHDLYSTSVDAALQVIDTLTERGFAFVTVSELAEIKGYDLAAGEVYHSFK